MCGIAGIFSWKIEEEHRPACAGARQSLARAVKRLSHRGPDDHGIAWIRGTGYEVGLGHTRLSIIDLSTTGHQPMYDPVTGNYIVFNGEIYNYKALRRSFDNASETWLSQTDTEVILKAYRKWGTGCVEHLRGMFVFALWDAQRQKLFIARDRLGIKPLYYYAGEKIIVFASEVRAILASEVVPRQIDPIALNEYLTYQSVPAPRTMIKGVRALSPGMWMMVDAAGIIEERKYWDMLQNTSAHAYSGKAETRGRIAELLQESAELHLASDVPLGVFLSGGIDSSAIVALISELGYTPRTFSVAFAERNFDESIFARQVAARFRAEHAEIRLTESAMLDQLPDALAAMDQPTGDGINTYIVSKSVKDAGVTVALSGLGGDEFFAGYPSFPRLEKAMRYQRAFIRLPASARNAAARVVKLAGGKSVQATKAAAMIKSDGSLAAMYPITRQVLAPAQRHALLSKPWRRLNEEFQDPYVDLLRSAFTSDSSAELLARISYAEARTYMHDVLLRDTDQMSMAHALEVRVPLLDHKLVEYVMGVPDEFKRPNGTPKSLLVESLGALLPKEVVHRPKQGFTLPFAQWMRGDLRKYCEERLCPERIIARGIFDADEITKLWRSFINGSQEVSWSRLWVLVTLEEWLERNRAQCSM